MKCNKCGNEAFIGNWYYLNTFNIFLCGDCQDKFLSRFAQWNNNLFYSALKSFMEGG